MIMYLLRLLWLCALRLLLLRLLLILSLLVFTVLSVVSVCSLLFLAYSRPTLAHNTIYHIFVIYYTIVQPIVGGGRDTLHARPQCDVSMPAYTCPSLTSTTGLSNP